METLLVVDTDIEVYEFQTAEWEQYGVISQRVNTMYEAINLLVYDGPYLMVAINEDTFPDCRSKILIMRDVSATPIFVISSTYTIDKKIAYMQAGVSYYGSFRTLVKKNIIASLKILRIQSIQVKRPREKLPVLISGDIILSTSRWVVWVKDTPVKLSKLEFKILQYLMEYRDHVRTHTQIFQEVKGDGDTANESDFIWRTISRIRGKLAKVSNEKEYIKAERGIGYKFMQK